MRKVTTQRKQRSRSVLVDHLPEVALLVQQTHTDHRDTQVAIRFELDGL